MERFIIYQTRGRWDKRKGDWFIRPQNASFPPPYGAFRGFETEEAAQSKLAEIAETDELKPGTLRIVYSRQEAQQWVEEKII